MEKDIPVKLSLWIGLAAIVICAITAGYSYHAYNSSQNIQRAHKKSLDTLHQEITRLEAKITELGNELATAQGQVRGPTGDLKSPKNKPSASRSSVSHLQTLEQMEQILDSTGLAQLAENENVDPNILLQMYDEYAQRNQVASYRQQLIQTDRERFETDRKNYEAELMSLYELARHRRGSDTDREIRQKAFEEMLEKYPDAYATAKVIAERAVRSAFRRNTTAAEEYYHLLRENDKFSSVTTDRGLEVLPNIEHYLAQQYLRDGRIEDARVLRDSLELNFSDSYILTREPGTGWKWLPVSQAVSKLDQQIK
jgi:tetratricopeptide (TPR) repeat protein